MLTKTWQVDGTSEHHWTQSSFNRSRDSCRAVIGWNLSHFSCPREILSSLFSSAVVDSHSSWAGSMRPLIGRDPRDTFWLDNWTTFLLGRKKRKKKNPKSPCENTHSHTDGDTHSEECVFRSVWTIELKWFHTRSVFFSLCFIAPAYSNTRWHLAQKL